MNSLRVVIADDRSLAQAGLLEAPLINLDDDAVSAALAGFGARALDAQSAWA